MEENLNNVHPKRMVERLNAYWNLLRGNAEVPQSIRFSGGTLGDVYDNCLKINVSTANDVKIYHCDYVGRKLPVAFSGDLQNRYFIQNNMSNFSKHFMESLNFTSEKRCFFKSEGQFVNTKGQIVKYRDCIMPLADTKDNIKTLVVGISWRAY